MKLTDGVDQRGDVFPVTAGTLLAPTVLLFIVVGSFFVPGIGWFVGIPAVVIHVLWVWLLLRRIHNRITVQEERYDRRRQLISTLAHELRTPLTVIRSSVTILMEETSLKTLSEQQRRFVGSIFTNVHRIEALTENVLAGLKIDSWSESLRLRPIDLRKEVVSVARAMEPALVPRDQKIHYMFPSRLSRVLADPQWIGQVLVNLVHNAGKYMDKGGTIDMTVTENENFLVLSVSDNGFGIPQRRPDLFEPFVQGDPQRPISSEGTGLGLAIVKRVITLHGGEVHVASRKDGGTSVSITLKKAGTDE